MARERIGGRWAISWVTYVVIAVATVVTVPFDGPESPREFLSVAATGAAAACAVLLLADLTVLRRRRVVPVSPWLVVAVGVGAGAARAAAMIAVADGMAIPAERTPLVIYVGSILLATVAVVGVALLRDAVSRHRQERAALVARLASLRELTGERAELAEAIADAASDEMMSVLDDARRGIEVPVGEMSVDDRLALAADLRRTVNEQLRPMSHRLYAAGRRPEPAYPAGLRGVASSLRRLGIFPAASALVVAAVTAAFAEYAVGPVIVGVIVWAGLAAVVALAKRSEGVMRRRLALALGLSSITAAASVAILRWAEGESQIAGVVIATVVTVIALTIFTSLVGTLITDDPINARLAEEVDARELEAMLANRELARTSRELAQYVHGTLQANLLTIALAVEKAAQDGDDAAFARAVSDARSALAQAPPVEPSDRDLATALARAGDLWRGFVDVEVDIAPGIDALMSPSRVTDIGRIAGEAIANARKHGGARHVTIAVQRMSAAPGDLCVRVVDDGAGPQGGVKGMGLAWLDFIAPGAWTLGPGAGGRGACLEVRLPVPTTDGAAIA